MREGVRSLLHGGLGQEVQAVVQLEVDRLHEVRGLHQQRLQRLTRVQRVQAGRSGGRALQQQAQNAEQPAVLGLHCRRQAGMVLRLVDYVVETNLLKFCILQFQQEPIHRLIDQGFGIRIDITSLQKNFKSLDLVLNLIEN